MQNFSFMSVLLGQFILFVFLQQVSSTKYRIITDDPPKIINEQNKEEVEGVIKEKYFKGPNSGNWTSSVAFFDIPEGNKSIFEDSSNTVTISGNNSLTLNTTGDFALKTNLNVNGQLVNGLPDDTLFVVGGFVRTSNSCCVLGAGPGAAFSYHGAGHGGRGGGFYQDRNSSRFYSWDYHDMEYLLGGSTSTVMFKSKPGSGGGAIEIVTNGTLTIDAEITADGFTSNDTDEDHCAGGSAGGLIRLVGETVNFTSRGKLSVKGGNSGTSSKTKSHCGDGGGGGVIQVFARRDNVKYLTDRTKLKANGGRGIENGEEGVVFNGVFFDTDTLDVNTTNCTIKWHNLLLHTGSLVKHKYNKMSMNYYVCSFVFQSDVHIGSKANIKVTGGNSLRIISEYGNIELMTDLNLTSKGVGGFTDLKGPGTPTKCNATGLYEYNFNVLVGGSVCTSTNAVDLSSTKVFGGGAIELRARRNGTIVIGSKIIADGSSESDDAGAMGGTIRLIANEVHLKNNALLSAKASQKGTNLASGGIIQIKSNQDVQGLCESKFEVSGGKKGLVIINVSAKSSYQVQFIQRGTLLIDTTLCIWSHQTTSNVSIAYSQFGEAHNTSTSEGIVTICSFGFQTPIIVNGSTAVELSGQYALSIRSKEGIYIGVDFVVDGSSEGTTDSFLGGYCVANSAQAREGAGPGKGYNNSNAGGGHGGRGGFFKEVSGTVYGRQYGNKTHLIGGSTGTSTSSSESRGCGGGAIKIASQRNLTIDAAITVNGYAHSNGDFGGSSGGTIILEGKQVILTGRATLEAKGSNATGNKNTGGGGGGGVIVIDKLNSASNRPNVNIATSGGQGYRPGESGVVFVDGVQYRKSYKTVVEESRNFTGCYVYKAKPKGRKYSMPEHEAFPSTCLKFCKERTFPFALINSKACHCESEISSLDPVLDNSTCNTSCPGNYTYRCGGEVDSIFIVYSTGIKPPVPTTTEGPTVGPTQRPFEKPSEEFEALNNITITRDNAHQVVKDLNNLTTVTDLNGGDTLVAVSIVEKLASGDVLDIKNRNETKQTGQAIIETAGALLGTKNSKNWEKIMSSNTTETHSPNNVLEYVEKIGIKLGRGLEPEKPLALESTNVVLVMERVDLSISKDETYPPYKELSREWQYGDYITIPEESIAQLKESGANQTTIVFVLYNGINDALKSNLASDRMINSKVLSLTLDQNFTEPFVKPVTMTLTKTENWDNLTDPECSFLDFKKSLKGNWSNFGCERTSSINDPKVQCQCNHLTNFAVLMQVKDFKISRAHQKALQMITYIGCGISLFGLALTLATFLSLETLASERTSIHKNLVVAIGLAQIIFLAGIDAVYNPIACKIVALALHYLYMAAFTWMCCEGIHLYTKVIEVFSSETSKMKYYYMLGWGAPLIIVIISAASRMEGYGTQTACWISIKDGLIWAFVGPVLIIMCINLVVMVMVIKVILASVTSIQTPGNTSQVKAGLKGMVVLLPLLGLTWVFGLMAVNEKTIAFQYVFAILNSLQGLFIFAFHCIGNSEVRVAYKRLHEKRTLAKMPEHSLSSGNHHKNVEDFKRRMNSRETNSTGDEDIIVTKAIRSVSDVKLSGGQDHVAMQTFGDADSGRWSLNCPSPDPPCVSYQPPASKSPRREPRAAPTLTDVPQQPTTPRESYRSNRNMPERNRFVKGEPEGQMNGYQRF